uniref:heme oxygenase (biliverdin-producing) n=1 Tax=Nelumbo nucifera TaxID=4432 RepID=A0A822Y749_NELNU|nr:TPA_asm: hypothetical protein HUJ06_028627 [Nelumbo nucifera]
MRFVAMKLHTKDQAKEGEKEPEGKPIAEWEPTFEGYLRFLVDSKLVYDTLDSIVQKAAYASYAEFRNTGLESSENLAKDLEWFKKQGHVSLMLAILKTYRRRIPKHSFVIFIMSTLLTLLGGE